MFSAPRTFLVIFLALLQFVAPLVHAHAGENFFAVPSHDAGKLHVPGLESYGGGYAGLMSDVGALQAHVARLDAPSEGIVFGIDTGIKQKQHNDEAGVDHYYLPQKFIVFKAPIAVLDSISPRSSPRILGCYLFSPHSPRAPPAL